VVLGDQLRHPSALAVHGDEVADQVEQHRRLEHALDKHLVLRPPARRKIPAIDRLPRREMLPASSERTRAGLGAVGDHRHLVPGEDVGDLCPIGLDLVERATQCRVLISGPLEFHQHQRQAIDEQHHVRAALPGAQHGELVDRKVVVVSGVVEVEQPGPGRANGPVVASEVDRYALHQ
jgi:hypothetical protein